MKSTPTSPTPGRRALSTAGEWPLLARLPDVSNQHSNQTDNAKRLAATPATAHRLDTPRPKDGALRELDPPIDDEARTASELPNDDRSRSLPQPHLLQRTWRVDQANSAPRRTSPALPSSNPFAIPTTSLHEAIAPIVRFALLCFLFTAAGTTILMAGRANRAKLPSPAPAAAATTGPLLEPTTVIEPIPAAVELPTSAATASIPPYDSAAQPVDQLTGSLPSFPDVLPPANGDASPSKETISEHAKGDSASSAPTPAATAPQTSWWPLTGEGQALPQVRTSDPPTAVANLPGYILESPSRQASNDDQQSVY